MSSFTKMINTTFPEADNVVTLKQGDVSRKRGRSAWLGISGAVIGLAQIIIKGLWSAVVMTVILVPSIIKIAIGFVFAWFISVLAAPFVWFFVTIYLGLAGRLVDTPNNPPEDTSVSN